MTDPISNLIEFGEKTVNDVKNVRSIDDVTKLGKVNFLIDQKEFDHEQSLEMVLMTIYVWNAFQMSEYACLGGRHHIEKVNLYESF